MAMIYVKDITRKKIQLIAENQHRDISDEIALMVEKRFLELNLPDVDTTPETSIQESQ